MTTKAKKQTNTTSRKKKLTLKNKTVRDLSVGEKGGSVRSGHVRWTGNIVTAGC